eukprot:TRINITY_DN363_c0_g2_i2.p1 TRINITY_DN363_c0_g2~~TRINITY_DN363_c0_g2_i2.p1  ORF type:complete len:577 (-),score=188.55 TRINITY_DN363_c0_g2_i2:504-2234(-)
MKPAKKVNRKKAPPTLRRAATVTELVTGYYYRRYALAAAVVGIAFIIFFFSLAFPQIKKNQEYIKTQALVMDQDQESKEEVNARLEVVTMYRCWVKVRYSVNAVFYHEKIYNKDNAEYERSPCLQSSFMTGHAINATVSVYYDPDSPSTVVFSVDYSWSMIIIGGILGFGFLVCIVLYLREVYFRCREGSWRASETVARYNMKDPDPNEGYVNEFGEPIMMNKNLRRSVGSHHDRNDSIEEEEEERGNRGGIQLEQVSIDHHSKTNSHSLGGQGHGGEKEKNNDDVVAATLAASMQREGAMNNVLSTAAVTEFAITVRRIGKGSVVERFELDAITADMTIEDLLSVIPAPKDPCPDGYCVSLESGRLLAPQCVLGAVGITHPCTLLIFPVQVAKRITNHSSTSSSSSSSSSSSTSSNNILSQQLASLDADIARSQQQIAALESGPAPSSSSSSLSSSPLSSSSSSSSSSSFSSESKSDEEQTPCVQSQNEQHLSLDQKQESQPQRQQEQQQEQEQVQEKEKEEKEKNMEREKEKEKETEKEKVSSKSSSFRNSRSATSEKRTSKKFVFVPAKKSKP